MHIQARYETLKRVVGKLDKVLVAYSGGMDSTLLLRTCVDVLGKENVLAFIGNGPIFSAKAIQEARSVADEVGAEYILRDTAILKDKAFVENTKSRCYYCKKKLLGLAVKAAEEKGMEHLVDGTNLDDTNDFRPGTEAAKEMKVTSPLLAAGLTKHDIGILSRRLGLSTHDKPADACLATRVPYGTPINAALLKRV